MEEDTENYMYFKLMGGRLKLKANVLPSKFAWNFWGKRDSFLADDASSQSPEARVQGECGEQVGPEVTDNTSEPLHENSKPDLSPEEPHVKHEVTQVGKVSTDESSLAVMIRFTFQSTPVKAISIPLTECFFPAGLLLI